MEPSYYTIVEAATLLDRRPTDVHRLCETGDLRWTRSGGETFVLRADVQELYEHQADPGRARRQVLALEGRIARLEEELSLIRHVPAFEHTRPPMSAARLAMERESALALIAQGLWGWDQVMSTASWCHRMPPDEARSLFDAFGPAALTPWTDLLQRMQAYIVERAANDEPDFGHLRAVLDRSLLHLTNLTAYRARIIPKDLVDEDTAVLEELLEPGRGLDELLLDAVIHVARVA